MATYEPGWRNLVKPFTDLVTGGSTPQNKPKVPRPGDPNFIGPVKPPVMGNPNVLSASDSQRFAENPIPGVTQQTPTTPVNTMAPAPVTSPTTPAISRTGPATGSQLDPTFQANALQQVYAQRPDLQELYNLDGSAKNPNDPRIAGIPTLQDWAEQYGSKEVQNLAGFAKPTMPTTSDGQQINPATGGVTAPATPATPQPTATETAVSEAEKRYQANIGLSQEEIDAQAELDRINESLRQGYLGEGDRPIPLPFITGRQRALEQRAATLALPIQAQAALAQAKRTSALAESKFALERADKALERETEQTQQRRQEKLGVAEALLTSGANQDQINSILGAKSTEEAMALAAQTGLLKPQEDGSFTLGEGQVRYNKDGTVIASNVGSDGLIGGFGAEGYIPGVYPEVDGWVGLINSGQANITNVPEKLRTAVANALTAGGATTNEAEIETLQNKIATFDELMNHEGMAKSVGPSKFARWTPFKIDTWNGQTQDFVGKVHQLTSKETLDFLIQLKAAGGTLGALNQKELETLQQSATAINDWEIKDDKGNGTGKWNISEAKFKEELGQLQSLAQTALERAVGTGGDTGIAPNQQNIAEFQARIRASNPNISDEELRELTNEAFGQKKNSGMRTDRHNNPAAFTTDIAKQAGLREGVDYIAGDPFPNNPNLRTARLLGNPVDQTIKVIDRIGFFTPGGKQRWSYIAMDQNIWNRMSRKEKVDVVQHMYQREGNRGVLNRYFT